MICATVYEYKSFSPVEDIEFSSVSNNNDKTNDFVDKNRNQDRTISIGQENGQELIEKGMKHPQKENSIQGKNDSEGYWHILSNLFAPYIFEFFNVSFRRRFFRILAEMSACIQPHCQRK